MNEWPFMASAIAERMLSAVERAETAGDFLLNFHHTDILLSLVVGERDGEIVEEGEDTFRVMFKPVQKILRFSFGDASSPRNRGRRQGRMFDAALSKDGVVTTDPASQLLFCGRRGTELLARDESMHGQKEEEHFSSPPLMKLQKEEFEFPQ